MSWIEGMTGRDYRWRQAGQRWGMATIDSFSMVQQIIDGNGYYPGDEHAPVGPVVRITEFVNGRGNAAWGIVYRREAQMGLLDRYQRETEFVQAPEVIWELPREKWGGSGQ